MLRDAPNEEGIRQLMDKVTVFKDAGGEWRWHRQSENGEVVSTSGEGYIHQAHAVEMAKSLNSEEDAVVVVSDAE